MKKLLLLSTSLTACSFLAFTSSIALANPEGGVVSAGTASIETSVGRVDVHQSSDKAVIDWRSFNINNGETTQFHQPGSSSLTVNRINDANPSQILGNLKANGNIVLINQSGISFGKDAVVDVGGLIATTSEIGNGDAMVGHMAFTASGNPDATISNAGKITAREAGLVGLVAPNVENSGIINARLGKIHLGSGDQYTLDLYGDGAISIQASDALQNQIVSNTGTLAADGGVIQVTAATGANLVSSLVQIDGELLAPSVSMGEGGKIIISGSDATNVSLTGTLNASGVQGGSISLSGHNVIQQGKLLANGTAGQGGSVDVRFKNAYLDSELSHVEAKGSTGQGGAISVKGDQGSRAFISGQYNVSSTNDKGGSVKITAADGDLKLFGAKVTSDGKLGGGLIEIGGEFQGGGTLEHAKTTSVNYSATLSADATDTGKGGEVIVWSDEETLFGGTVQARGGVNGGDGGQIEISSKDTMKIAGNATTTAAARMHGYVAGNLLLDPKNITIETGGIAGGISYFEFVDPNPDAGNFGTGFIGSGTTLLSNGNVVITDYNDDLMATNSGAAYLFNGNTGGLISTLTGSKINDMVGVNGATELSNGNYVILSGDWGNGATLQAGAVTWASAATGINGIVTSANSLVGSHADDAIGGWGIWTLDNGNYLVRGTRWNSSRGALTWGNGLGGTVGVVSSANSLVGSTSNDIVGDKVVLLENGNYVAVSSRWDNGAIANVGAVTWGNGLTGTTGVVTAANSLIGSSANDYVGGDQWGNIQVIGLDNGNYFVGSPYWDNSSMAATDAGALTWGNGLGGTVGAISSANSLVGTSNTDLIGYIGSELGNAIVRLVNGNYIAVQSGWDNGAATDAGAVTWLGDASFAMTGNISAANSLVGSSDNDMSNVEIATLSNGNYLVVTPDWDNGAATNAGAITWASGATGITGAISSGNSLVGGSADDQVGYDYIELANGNYVVMSSVWDNGAIVDAGAVTWASGTAGVTGVVSSTNSLVGSSTDDLVGSGGVTALGNGNYVVGSDNWDNGVIADVGAATWVDGSTGLTGAVSAANSLIGTTAFDYVGWGAVETSDNNYVVISPGWGNGGIVYAGAVTWADGSTGLVGVVSTANSLVGTTNDSFVGSGGVTALDNGSYVVLSPDWNDGVGTSLGAVTWVNPLVSTVGTVSVANSLVGTTNDSFVGSGGVTALGNGNYVVLSPDWNDGVGTSLGAVTWVNPLLSTAGTVSAANSLIGTTDFDQIGSDGVYVLTNGNYLVGSPNWDNGVATDAGAATWGSGNTGTFGAVSSANSLVGSSTNDQISARVNDWEGVELPSGNVILVNLGWDNGAATDAGAVTWVDGNNGSFGVIGASNSVVGTYTNDVLGWRDWDQPVLSNGDYALHAGYWNNSSGAFIIIDGDHGTFGEISSYNAILGTSGMWPNYKDNDDEINGRYIVVDGGGKVYSVDYLSQDNIGDFSSYSDFASSDISLDPGFITNVLNAGTSVTLQASNDITLSDDLIVNNTGGDGGTLTFQAGRSILLNADIFSDNGDINLFGNEDFATGVVNAQRDAGAAVIAMGAGASIDAGTGIVTIRLDDGAGKTNSSSGDISLRDITAGTILARNMNTSGDVILQSGTLTATDAGDALTLVSGRNFINNSGPTSFSTPSGRWLVYSTTPAANTLGGLVEDFSLYSCVYGGSCPALQLNNGLLYSWSGVTPPPPSGSPSAIEINLPETVDYMSLGGFLRDLQGKASISQNAGFSDEQALAQNGANENPMTVEFSYAHHQKSITAGEEARGSYISIHPWLKEFLSNPFAMLLE